jgi:penicillin-binding protein 1C
LVTARVALAASLNVPAVKTVGLVGLGPFVQKLRQLGFDDLLEAGDFYGPSLALGSADVSLWDLVNAYRALANDGIWSEMKLVPSSRDASAERRVFSPQAAFLVSHILSDREARSSTFGLETALALRYWAAVKTGTSKDMRDNWCIGYSKKFTVGVWVGNFSAEPMWNVSGITGAAPIWSEIMNRLHRNETSLPKVPPAGLVSRKTDGSPLGSVRVEWFIAGTEPNLVRPRMDETDHRILYPVQGTVIALDPDIPVGQQQAFFEATPRDNRLRWRLNGEEIGPAGDIRFWNPRPGIHDLSLLDKYNRVVDAVKFQVRGNGVN